MNAPVPNPNDGNRTVFKPSPLKGLKKPAPTTRAPEPAAAGPAEVTAVPLATARPPERPHEDLTYFSPTIPDAAPPPGEGSREAPAPATTPPAAEPAMPRGSLWPVLALTILAVVVLLVWVLA